MPIITLMTDFGMRDGYVGAMKGAMLSVCPSATLVDITHRIPPGDVAAGAFVWRQAIDTFPAGAVHLAVVDPGVGTARRLLAVVCGQWTFVAPDNGLLTWIARDFPATRTHELDLRRLAALLPGGMASRPASATFHGRDLLGPAAALLASGCDMQSLGGMVDAPMRLAMREAVVSADGVRGEVVYVDHYGNAISNIGSAQAGDVAGGRVRVNGRDVGAVRRTYGDVNAGEPLALIGSAGLLEIAVRDGNAAERLGMKVGDAVEILAAK